MQAIGVYLNPRASRGEAGGIEEQIEKQLFRYPIVFRRPDGLTALKNQIEDDIASGEFSALACVGGDGTVNTMIQYLKDQKVGLLVIPAGTANDLAHELGNHNLRNAFRAIRNKESKKMDLISVNGVAMATNGGIGLGGDVSDKINKLRKRFPQFKNLMKYSGKNIYTFMLASEILSGFFDRYKLSINSKEFSGDLESSVVLINNQPKLAGTFNIAPETCHLDGKVNVTILTHPNRALLARFIMKTLAGEIPKNDPYYITFETASLSVKVREEKLLPFFGDGEILQKSNQFQINVLPESLKVFCRLPEGLGVIRPEVALS